VPRRPGRASHRALVVALGAVLAGTVVALSLTAPGRATAEWVGHHLSELTGRDPHPQPHGWRDRPPRRADAAGGGDRQSRDRRSAAPSRRLRRPAPPPRGLVLPLTGATAPTF
jgi:hypothetical protein